MVRGAVGFLLLVVALSWGRAVVESRRYARWGDEAVAAGDWESAVLHYRHALQWYAPLGSAAARSFDALVGIGAERRSAGDVEGALVAYRSARMGVMAIRHLGTPFAARLPALHRDIGALMAEQVARSGSGDAAADAARFAAQLDAWRDRRPNPALGLAASLGFVAWLASLGMLAARGFDRSGARTAEFRRWLFAAAVALVCWLSFVRLA